MGTLLLLCALGALLSCKYSFTYSFFFIVQFLLIVKNLSLCYL